MINKQKSGWKRSIMLLLFFLVMVPLAWAQAKVTVTGTVVDDLDEPLIGVSVLEVRRWAEFQGPIQFKNWPIPQTYIDLNTGADFPQNPGW